MKKSYKNLKIYWIIVWIIPMTFLKFVLFFGSISILNGLNLGFSIYFLILEINE